MNLTRMHHYWNSLNEIKLKWKKDRIFLPKLNKSSRIQLLNGWKSAVNRTLLK